MSAEFDRVDLTNCDREPIHQLGAIQPFGFLLAISSDWLVSRVSDNIGAFLNVDADSILGRPVSEVISRQTVHALRNRLAAMRGPDAVERLFGITLSEGGPLFDLAIHPSGDYFVLEAEPSQDGNQGGSTLSVRAMMARLDQAASMDAFFREGARQARALTGFDRVMVYRFDETGSGEVVAEAARPGIGSFLGLHYPASDIPAQARTLYLRNLFRIIADVNAEPVPIRPALDNYGRPLDLSMSTIRSVSPIHIEYLKNMGVEASLSISIVVDGALWGLFACHHYSPRLPSFERRSTAELFGQMFASRLESRERRLALDYETKARRIADHLMTSVASNASLLDDPAWLIEALADAIPADGIGVWINGRSATNGIAPSPEHFSQLIKRLNRNAAGVAFATDSITALYPDLGIDDAIAGFLAIPISRSPRDYVVLFRQEMVRTIRWAGDPHKPVEYGPNGPRLTPRKSFESWSELVRGRSLPFTPAEKRVAETLRVTLIEVVLRLADEASAVRQQANERQEVLIAELNHRVRNILSLISGLIRQSRSESVTIAGYVEQLEGRVQSLARAHEQITRDHWAPASLRVLLEAEAAAYLGKAAARIVATGDPVLLNPQAFSTAALVFHELVTNSAKYGSLSDSGTVSVTWEIEADGGLAIQWRESGGPPVKEPKRQGFGTTIILRSIPYDLDGRADLRFSPTGVEADFRIPGKYVSRLEPGAAHPVPTADRPATVNAPTNPGVRLLEDKTVLLVEDNLIIAMDGEDILHQLGAGSILLAPSTAQAIELLGKHKIDIALLDINLGEETSFPIAKALDAKAIPFIFATGYGETTADMAQFQQAAFLQKPYTLESVANALARLAMTAPL